MPKKGKRWISATIVASIGATVVLVLSWIASWQVMGQGMMDPAPALGPTAQIYFPQLSHHSTPTPTPTATPTPSPTATPTPTPLLPPPPGDWLAYLNYYRALAELPPVTENASWSEGAWLHSRYMVKNDLLTHAEDPANSWYTPEGNATGLSSNVLVSPSVDTTDEVAFDVWMQAPFHALGILDSRLLSVGYSSYREAVGTIHMGATLDISRGRDYDPPPSVQFPVLWPADGMISPLRMHGGSYPSPLTSCPGYSAPTGLPIIVQIGSGSLTPNVTAHTFEIDGTPLEHCVFDETNYIHPDPTLQRLVRLALGARDAIMLIPREPLTPGATYHVSLTTNGQTYTWSFSVSASAPEGEGMPEQMTPLTLR